MRNGFSTNFTTTIVLTCHWDCNLYIWSTSDQIFFKTLTCWRLPRSEITRLRRKSIIWKSCLKVTVLTDTRQRWENYYFIPVCVIVWPFIVHLFRIAKFTWNCSWENSGHEWENSKIKLRKCPQTYFVDRLEIIGYDWVIPAVRTRWNASWLADVWLKRQTVYITNIARVQRLLIQNWIFNVNSNFLLGEYVNMKIFEY
jgi:hypothetical protein